LAHLALHAPDTIEEASQLLGQYQGEARAVAGGTAVVLMLRQGLIRPPALVRLDRLQELKEIGVEDGALRIGALATLQDIGASQLVANRVPVLAATCQLVANIRVRNAATIGGNLAEADYASDPPGVLLALDGRVRAQRGSTTREIPVAELVTDFYDTSLAPDELITDVLVPLPPAGGRVVYLKFITRSAEDRPCLGATALLRFETDGRIAEARAAIGGIAGKPIRFPDIEAVGRGQQPSDELFAEIGRGYADRVDPVGDVRGSAEYRKDMTAVFVRRALQAAARGESGARKV
jgi:carbon-monoxide dehydrogenase medium subunit